MECKIDLCKKEARAKGFCAMHYQRQREGRPLVLPYDNSICLEDECKLQAGTRTGLCKKHYKRNWLARLNKFDCTVEGCSRKQRVVGLCDIHSNSRKIPKVGNKSIGTDGYIYVYAPGHPNADPSSCKIAEHRLIMSEHLKRPLKKHENVHHKNGNRIDNSIDNLELWTRSQPIGTRVEDKVQWCIEFLKEYGYDVL